MATEISQCIKDQATCEYSFPIPWDIWEKNLFGHRGKFMTHPTMTWKVKCCAIHLESTHWNVAFGAALEGITSCCFYSFFSLFCEMLDAQSAPVIWFMPDKFESIQQTSKLKEFPKVRLSGCQTWSNTSLCWLPIDNDGTCSLLRRAPFDQWHHLWRCDPLL